MEITFSDGLGHCFVDVEMHLADPLHRIERIHLQTIGDSPEIWWANTEATEPRFERELVSAAVGMRLWIPRRPPVLSKTRPPLECCIPRSAKDGCSLGSLLACRDTAAALQPVHNATFLPALERGCARGDPALCASLTEEHLADSPLTARDPVLAATLAKYGCDMGEGRACTTLGHIQQRGLAGMLGPPPPSLRSYAVAGSRTRRPAKK
jgi:hypothetical protein